LIIIVVLLWRGGGGPGAVVAAVVRTVVVAAASIASSAAATSCGQSLIVEESLHLEKIIRRSVNVAQLVFVLLAQFFSLCNLNL
jgi:hypothetical protein